MSERSTRTVLVISGGHGVLPAIAEAHRLGLRVVAAAAVPGAPGFMVTFPRRGGRPASIR